jgi:1-pyrroline-5-carboxylate dehydrogenase
MQRPVVASLLRAPWQSLGSRHYAALVANRSSAPDFATVDPQGISAHQVARVFNLVHGEWTGSSEWEELVDPLNGRGFIKVPNTLKSEVTPFIDSLRACPKSGLHNPLKNPERYLLYGDVSAKVAHSLSQPEVCGS